jgi:hypothetical protein
MRGGDLSVTGLEIEKDFDPKAIERQVQRKTLAWFFLVAAMLIGAGGFSFLRLRSTIESYANDRIEGVTNGLHDMLQVTDTTYRILVAAAIKVLQNESLDLGAPRLADGGSGGEIGGILRRLRPVARPAQRGTHTLEETGAAGGAAVHGPA